MSPAWKATRSRNPARLTLWRATASIAPLRSKSVTLAARAGAPCRQDAGGPGTRAAVEDPVPGTDGPFHQQLPAALIGARGQQGMLQVVAAGDPAVDPLQGFRAQGTAHGILLRRSGPGSRQAYL